MACAFGADGTGAPTAETTPLTSERGEKATQSDVARSCARSGFSGRRWRRLVVSSTDTAIWFERLGFITPYMALSGFLPIVALLAPTPAKELS